MNIVVKQWESHGFSAQDFDPRQQGPGAWHLGGFNISFFFFGQTLLRFVKPSINHLNIYIYYPKYDITYYPGFV